MTLPIKSFVVVFENGSTKEVEVQDGETGFYREQEYKGRERTFTTYECFVADGATIEAK